MPLSMSPGWVSCKPACTFAVLVPLCLSESTARPLKHTLHWVSIRYFGCCLLSLSLLLSNHGRHFGLPAEEEMEELAEEEEIGSAFDRE